MIILSWKSLFYFFLFHNINYFRVAIYIIFIYHLSFITYADGEYRYDDTLLYGYRSFVQEGFCPLWWVISCPLSFQRVQCLPMRFEGSRYISPSHTCISLNKNFQDCMVSLLSALYRLYLSCWKQQRHVRFLRYSFVSFSYGSTCLILY